VSAIDFVGSLLNRGVARVAALSFELVELKEAIQELDRAVRPELAYDAPPLSESSAVWGLTTLYRSCQFLAYREVEEETVRQTLSAPCPDEPSPSVCYSVDLAMRYVPELHTLTRGIAPADPLTASLLALGRAWPLSSVGLADLGDLDLAPFIDHRSLRQLYVDRIIERRDSSRVLHPLVWEAARAAVGGFPGLAPFLSERINNQGPVQQRNFE
jgi:hypothetical protein